MNYKRVENLAVRMQPNKVAAKLFQPNKKRNRITKVVIILIFQLSITK